MKATNGILLVLFAKS